MFTKLNNSIKLILIMPLFTTLVFAKTLKLDEVPVGQSDPAKATDSADSIIFFNVYDTLVLDRAKGSGVEGLLAKSWTIKDNTYTFKLRKGIKFHSGNKLTVDDVIYSYNRMIKINQGFAYLFSEVQSVKKLDDYTVQFVLKKPFAPFLSSLVRLAIVDQKLVSKNNKDDHGQTFLSKNSAGSGAYKIKKHNPQKQTIFVQNKKYFKGFSANAPTKVYLKYGLKAATVKALMNKKKHDISSAWLPTETLAVLSKKHKLVSEGGMGGFYIKLNTQKKPLDDKNCRKALAFSVDYKTLILLNQVNSKITKAKATNGPIPEGMLGFSSKFPNYKQDMKKAKSYLAKCVYNAAAYEIEVSWIAEVPIEEKIALLLQDNFSKLGFKVKVTKLPWALYTQKVTKKETTPHVSQIFTSASIPDPDSIVYNMYHSSLKGTWMSPEWLSNEEIDDLLEQSRAATTQKARQAIYEKLTKILRDLQPTIYGYEEVGVYAVRKNIHIAPLEEDDNQFNTNGLNFLFRLIDIK